MSGPPEGVSPGDLWDQLTAIPRASDLYDFPRIRPSTGKAACQVRFVVLTQGETESALVAAEKEVQRLLKADGKTDTQSRGYEDLLKNELSIELLLRACKHPDDEEMKKPFFPSKQALRGGLSNDEVGVMVNQYNMLQTQRGPILPKKSRDELDGWISALTKAGDFRPLASCSLALLIDLVITMACQLYNSQTDTSSAGSLPEQPSETV